MFIILFYYNIFWMGYQYGGVQGGLGW